jgi:DNA-binding MarR family transcriptional regulator
MNEDLQELTSSLLEALAGIVSGLPRDVPADEVAPGVTRSQLTTLRYLAEHGTCEMHELAAGVGVTSPTMTSTVKLLVKKGLVERRHHEQDWRKVQITATPAGLAAQQEFAGARAEALARAFSALSAEQRALLIVSLPALRALAREVTELSDRP